MFHRCHTATAAVPSPCAIVLLRPSFHRATCGTAPLLAAAARPRNNDFVPTPRFTSLPDDGIVLHCFAASPHAPLLLSAAPRNACPATLLPLLSTVTAVIATHLPRGTPRYCGALYTGDIYRCVVIARNTATTIPIFLRHSSPPRAVCYIITLEHRCIPAMGAARVVLSTGIPVHFGMPLLYHLCGVRGQNELAWTYIPPSGHFSNAYGEHYSW